MSEEHEAELKARIEQLEAMLEKERRDFLSVLDSIVDGVYTTDTDRSITFWNKGARRITGFEPETVVGDSCKNLLSHVDESGNSLCENECPLSKTMDSSAPVYGKNVYSGTAWGRTVPVSVSCAPIIDSEGRVVGAVEVFRDISDQKRLEKQKSDFYSMITHDIKSPLTTVLGYSELILETCRSGSCAGISEFASQIRNSANRITGLVEDFLSISKISNGSMEPDREPLLAEDLVKKVSGEFIQVAAGRGLNLTVECGSGLPAVEADIKMMERALFNLVGNAFKYTPSGGSVSVSARIRPECGPAGSLAGECLEINVADTGPGVPAEDRGRLFELYFRAANSSGIEGTGIGLAIVKAVCEAHGGSATYEEAPGGGSSFTMYIPVNQRPAADRR